MISEAVYDLCRSPASVSSELAKAPSTKPADILADLFSRALNNGVEKLAGSNGKANGSNANANASDDLTRARECGAWGTKKPSDSFLRIFHDALSTLNENSLVGLVSPSLMGSSGTIPLTIVGPLPDITRHMSNCIVRAQKEVILVTSYWMHSNNSRLVTNAMRELSDRAGKRGEKVVMKIMYDRANMKHVSRSREVVQPKDATSSRVQLPAQEEIPHVDLQIVNCHDAFLGTLHSKYMIVDRRFALLMSNNIQDNDNLEMMVRVEGPIVDSFYDMFLISWNITLEPSLPMLDSPARDAEPPSLNLKVSQLSSAINGSKIHPFGPDTRRGSHLSKIAEHTAECPYYDSSIVDEAKRINASLTPRTGESRQDAVTRHLNIVERPDITGDAPEGSERDHLAPYVLHAPHEPFPMALVNREPYGRLSHSSVQTPQNAAFLAAINNAKSTLFIQTPDLNAEPLLEPLLNAVRRGVIVTCYLCLGYNDTGELLPFQNGTNEMTSNRLYNSLATEEEKSRLQICNYIGKDQTKPIHNKFKKRSCHIKLMIIDERVAIQGSGNLDTQSFYHSQETNLLLDSPQICREWLDALRSNQNTAIYGAVSKKDGCWRDPDTGEIAAGSIGIDPGRFSWMKGVVGAVNRVRGAGGF